MRHFIKTRIFHRRSVGHRLGDGSTSLANEPAVNLQTRLPPSQHSGDCSGGEATELASDNPHESHTQDHGKPSQPLSSTQETVPSHAGHPQCLQPTFEGLPPEIRLMIFQSGLGIEDLRAAVRASPALHRQYLDSDRKLLLRIALGNTLGPAFIDMWAAFTTSKVDLGPPKKTEKERIAKFMTKVMDLRESWAQGASLGEHFHWRDLVGMSQNYLSVVKPLIAYFSDLFLGNLCQQLGEGLGKTAPLPEGDVSSLPGSDSSSDNSEINWLRPYKDGDQVDGLAPQDQAIIDAGREEYLRIRPSRSEAVRLVRALYRVQMWCNIFGYGMGLTKDPACADSSEVACLFHETFEPWEVEEMICIFQHMQNMIDELFHDMRDDLSRFDEQHRGEIAFFNDRMDIRDYDYYMDSFIQSAVSRGLPYFLRFITLPEGDRDARLSPVIENLGVWLHEDMLSAVTYDLDRLNLHPSPNDVREDVQEPLLFLGDSFPVATQPGPPFCWCLMWRGTYSNRYGDDIPDEFRQWGYVFWDRERVVGSKARELLLRIWRDVHWEDPRGFPE